MNKVLQDNEELARSSRRERPPKQTEQRDKCMEMKKNTVYLVKGADQDS